MRVNELMERTVDTFHIFLRIGRRPSACTTTNSLGLWLDELVTVLQCTLHIPLRGSPKASLGWYQDERIEGKAQSGTFDISAHL